MASTARIARKIANTRRRVMGANIIAEQLDTTIVETAIETPKSFRIVISTQDHENYGLHCCECPMDEACTCEDHWKAKGGSDYQRDIGSANDVIAMGAKGIEAIADEMRRSVEVDSRSLSIRVMGWSLVPSTEETPGERDLREMREWGYLTDEQYVARLKGLIV